MKRLPVVVLAAALARYRGEKRLRQSEAGGSEYRLPIAGRAAARLVACKREHGDFTRRRAAEESAA